MPMRQMLRPCAVCEALLCEVSVAGGARVAFRACIAFGARVAFGACIAFVARVAFGACIAFGARVAFGACIAFGACVATVACDATEACVATGPGAHDWPTSAPWQRVFLACPAHVAAHTHAEEKRPGRLLNGLRGGKEPQQLASSAALKVPHPLGSAFPVLPPSLFFLPPALALA
eukprot:361255-Chlamydomonas_euryale.AAC.9